MESILRDLRFAIRALGREPGFTAFVCLTLALGIGANAAMFSIADRLLIRGPLHIDDPGRVVRLYATEQPAGMRGVNTSGFGHVTYDVLQSTSTPFAAVATYAINDGILGQGGEARPIKIGFASPSLFPLLGVRAAHGRVFGDVENSAIAPARVAVLSFGAWREWFGGSTDALGKTITVGDESFLIIGVMPKGFTGPQLGRVDVWAPAHLLGTRVSPEFLTSWNTQWLKIVGRLNADVSFSRAGDEATAARRRAYSGGDRTTAETRLWVAPLTANDVGSEATEVRVLRWLAGVAVVVLIIACANVANLLLARGLRRNREAAIRAALGASRLRVARMLIFESLLLAAGGAALGLVVATVVGGAARHVLFATVDWPASPVDAQALAISAVIAVATGLLIGIIPALRCTRSHLTDALKSGVREGGGQRSRLRAALTIAQATLSVVLLVGAGLFVKSLWMIRSVDLGIDQDRVLVVEATRPSMARFPVGAARDAERARRRSFYVDIVDAVRRIPGVEHASVATGTPFGNRFTVRLRVPGKDPLPSLPAGGPGISGVSEGYFDTVGTAIRRGRAFTRDDKAGSKPVAIISELMASTIWPGEDPMGQCLLIGDGSPPCSQIVGIAENTHRSRLREDPAMHYYVPVGQEPGFGGSSLLVRTNEPHGAVQTELRRLLTSLDPSISYVDAETIQARIDPQIRPWKLGATVFLLAGVLAALVAGIGMYSVMSYLVADRRREIGVRMALGAGPQRIARLIFRGSFMMALAGIIGGEVLAGLLSGQVAPLLFDTSPRDPLVFAGVGLTVLTVAFIATLVPAERARRVNPVEALKID